MAPPHQKQQARPQLYKKKRDDGSGVRVMMVTMVGIRLCMMCFFVVLVVGLAFLQLQLFFWSQSNTSTNTGTGIISSTSTSTSTSIRRNNLAVGEDTTTSTSTSSTTTTLSLRLESTTTRTTATTTRPSPQEMKYSSSSSSNSSNYSSSSSSSFSFLYNQESADELLQNLPAWIRDYVQWHSQMRRQFPGMELFTHPDAPPLLIRTCLGICGGLHDRLGQLPWDLYLGNATRRVILLAWQRPRSLEHFLIPNHPETLLDWTVPAEFQFGFDDMKRVRNVTALFDGEGLKGEEDHPTDDFWNHDIDIALERATTPGTKFAKEKILRHRILGHLGETVLQERLNRVLGGAMEDVHGPPHFGRIFWLFFRPSPPVEAWVQKIMVQDLDLQPQQPNYYSYYTAVHCRVRHPKATSHGWNVVGKNAKYPADKTGLPWEGPTRQFALDVATTALNCSRLISSSTTSEQQEPTTVYFLSDSNDLVRHVAFELADDEFVQANRSELDQSLYQLVRGGGGNQARPQHEQDHQHPHEHHQQDQRYWIRARDVSEETAHLDRQKGRPASSYYSTFVDLMLVIHAHCVVYGIGYYAAFGAKISGTSCQYLYQQEEWGHQVAKSSAKLCPNVLEEQEQQQQQQQQQQRQEEQKEHAVAA